MFRRRPPWLRCVYRLYPLHPGSLHCPPNRLLYTLSTAILITAMALNVRAAVFDVGDAAGFQAALDDAAVNGEADIINVAAGTYNQAFLYQSTEGFSLTISGAGAGATVLDDDPVTDGASLLTILDQSEGPAAASLEILVTGMTFQNNGLQEAPSPQLGAGLRIESNVGNVAVEESEFIDNYADASAGGGLFVLAQFGSVSAYRNAFTSNAALLSGGGAYLVLFESTVDASDNTFSGNTSLLDSGGGLYVSGSEVILSANRFLENGALRGAGAEINGTDLTVSANMFNGNDASDGNGGGLLAESQGPVLLSSNEFAFNQSASEGGGAYARSTVDVVTIVDNSFDSNISSFSGGGVFGASFSGAVTVQGNGFADNQGLDGGGAYAESSVCSPSLLRITTLPPTTARAVAAVCMRLPILSIRK